MTKEEKIKILTEYDKHLIRNLVPLGENKNTSDLSDEVLDKIRLYSNEWYVINNKSNLIKFTYIANDKEPIIIIAEWKHIKSGKLIYCNLNENKEEDSFIEKNIDERKIDNLIGIINLFDYFIKPYESTKSKNIFEITMSLEVQIEDQYKEVIDVAPKYGVIAEIGRKLLKYSGAKITDHIFP